MVLVLDGSAPMRSAWPLDPRRSCASVVEEIANRRIEALIARSESSPNAGPRCEMLVVRAGDVDFRAAWSGKLRGRRFVAPWELADSVDRFRPRSAAFPAGPSRSADAGGDAPDWVEGRPDREAGPLCNMAETIRAWRELHPGGGPVHVLAIGSFDLDFAGREIEALGAEDGRRAFAWIGPRDIDPAKYPLPSRIGRDPVLARWFAWTSPVPDCVRAAAAREGEGIAREGRMLTANEDPRFFEEWCLSEEG